MGTYFPNLLNTEFESRTRRPLVACFRRTARKAQKSVALTWNSFRNEYKTADKPQMQLPFNFIKLYPWYTITYKSANFSTSFSGRQLWIPYTNWPSPSHTRKHRNSKYSSSQYSKFMRKHSHTLHTYLQFYYSARYPKLTVHQPSPPPIYKYLQTSIRLRIPQHSLWIFLSSIPIQLGEFVTLYYVYWNLSSKYPKPIEHHPHAQTYAHSIATLNNP